MIPPRKSLAEELDGIVSVVVLWLLEIYILKQFPAAHHSGESYLEKSGVPFSTDKEPFPTYNVRTGNRNQVSSCPQPHK